VERFLLGCWVRVAGADGGEDGIDLDVDEGPGPAVGGEQRFLVVIPCGFEVGGAVRCTGLIALGDEVEGIGGDGTELGKARHWEVCTRGLLGLGLGQRRRTGGARRRGAFIGQGAGVREAVGVNEQPDGCDSNGSQDAQRGPFPCGGGLCCSVTGAFDNVRPADGEVDDGGEDRGEEKDAGGEGPQPDSSFGRGEAEPVTDVGT